MSEKNANSWLKNHSEQIPALDKFHHQVTELLQEGVASLKEVADIIMLDPGMSIALLQKVSSRLKQSGRPVADTIHTAMGLLGKPAITTLINQHRTLGDTCSDSVTADNFRQLLSQSHHAIEQLNLYAKLQGLARIDDTRTAMLLYNLGEMYACLFDSEKYQDYQNLQISKPNQTDCSSQVFGFDFIQLGKLLCREWALPDLLIESFEVKKNTTRKANLIQLAGDLTRQAELGWYHQAMLLAQNNCASYLNLSPKNTRQHIQSAALRAAQMSVIGDVFPAAARLILLPNIDKPVVVKKPEAETTKPTETRPFMERIKALLQSPNTTQSLIVNLLMNYLYEELKFSRVVLMTVSNDRKTLAARIGKGLDSDSPFQKLQIPIANAGLLKSLLQKPQALCITPPSYRKYESSLPGIFKATSLCDNFVLMSIFIGKKPIGLIYSDRSNSELDIDKDSYIELKTSVMTTSKALSVLAKRNIQTAA